MHPSRMRTDHSSSHSGGGGLIPPSDQTPSDQIPTPSDQTPSRPDTPLQTRHPLPPPSGRRPPVNRMTHACENVTFPTLLRYAVGNYRNSMNTMFTAFSCQWETPLGLCSRLELGTKSVCWKLLLQVVMAQHRSYCFNCIFILVILFNKNISKSKTDTDFFVYL